MFNSPVNQSINCCFQNDYNRQSINRSIRTVQLCWLVDYPKFLLYSEFSSLIVTIIQAMSYMFWKLNQSFNPPINQWNTPSRNFEICSRYSVDRLTYQAINRSRRALITSNSAHAADHLELPINRWMIQFDWSCKPDECFNRITLCSHRPIAGGQTIRLPISEQRDWSTQSINFKVSAWKDNKHHIHHDQADHDQADEPVACTNLFTFNTTLPFLWYCCFWRTLMFEKVQIMLQSA